MNKIEIKKNQTIIIEGDSKLRKGPGLSDWAYMRMMGWDATWGDKFSELMFCWYPELNLNIRTVAVGGSKTFSILERFDTFVKPHNPDWVFISVGGNDVTFGLTIQESQNNMEKYITKVQEECDGNVVYISGWKDCPHTTEGRLNIATERIERFAALDETVAKCGAFSIDVGTGLKEKALVLEKQWAGHSVYCAEKRDSHFNSVGHLIVAGEIMKGLRFI